MISCISDTWQAYLCRCLTFSGDLGATDDPLDGYFSAWCCRLFWFAFSYRWLCRLSVKGDETESPNPKAVLALLMPRLVNPK